MWTPVCDKPEGPPVREGLQVKRVDALLAVGGFGFRLEVNAGFLALLRCDGGRGRSQGVVTVAGLGEGNNVTDGLDAGEQCHHPVPAEGDAAVRRGTVLEAL